MKKRASAPVSAFRESLKDLAASPLMWGAVAPVLGYGIGKVEKHINRQQDAKERATAFREMLELHPHMRDYDQGNVVRLYNSIHTVAPQLAKDPLIAGAYLDNMYSSQAYGRSGFPNLMAPLKDLSSISKNISDHKDPGTPGADAFVESLRGFTKDLDKYVTGSIRTRYGEAKDRLEGMKETLRKRETTFKSHRDAFHKAVDDYEAPLSNHDIANTIKGGFSKKTHPSRGNRPDNTSYHAKTSSLGDMLRALKV